MLNPLITDPEDENSFRLIPGKLYAFIHDGIHVPRSKGIPIWKHPDSCVWDKDILGHIKPHEPFLFANNEREAKDGRCWCKVVYSDIIGYVLIAPFSLHLLIRDVTPVE